MSASSIKKQKWSTPLNRLADEEQMMAGLLGDDSEQAMAPPVRRASRARIPTGSPADVPDVPLDLPLVDDQERAIIGFFESLVVDDVSVEALLGRTESFLGRRVALRPGWGAPVMVSSGAPMDEGPDQLGHLRTELPTGEAVWLGARPDRAHLELILQQFASTCRYVLIRNSYKKIPRPDRLLERLLSEATAAERSEVLRELQLGEHVEVRVVLVIGTPAAAEAIRAQIAGRSAFVRLSHWGRGWVILTRDYAEHASLNVPTGARVAISTLQQAARAHCAFRDARAALRFTQPSTRDQGPYSQEECAIITADVLGGYMVLAERLSAEDIDAVEDVRLLDVLIRDGGREMLETLDVVVSTNSLRQAARQLHMHHSSVAHRVERAERHLGFGLDEPYGRNRLFLALLLRRLQLSANLL